MNNSTIEMIDHFSKPENAHKVQGGNVERFVFAIQAKHKQNGVSLERFQEIEDQIKSLVNESLIEQGIT